MLTDSKYGYSAFGDTLRISLLRAPRSPDPEADRGLHRFAYALLPHAGDWQDAGVVDEAARVQLADPLRRASPPGQLVSVDGGLVLDTVKRAEDSDALVLRLYEPHGGRGVPPHTGTGYRPRAVRTCSSSPVSRSRSSDGADRRCRSGRGRSSP